MIVLFRSIQMMQKYIQRKVWDFNLFSGDALSYLGLNDEAIKMYDFAL